METKKRLIDADELKSAVVEDAEIRGENFSRIIRHIEAQTRVDAVEVLRCQDCKYMTKRMGGHYCKIWQQYNSHGEKGFCSYGERKEDG